MSQDPRIARWHAYMQGGSDLQLLSDMLADDAVFHSPVVHTPQEGKAKVMLYLLSAAKVLGDDAMLEFTATIDGIHVNGIDLIHFGPDGKIKDFKVMVRPMKAMNKLWEMMAAQLKAAS